MIQIKIDNQKSTKLNNPVIVSDSINFVTLVCQFSSEWNGLSKHYQFGDGTRIYEVATNSNTVQVPMEALKTDTLTIGVYGDIIDLNNNVVTKMGTMELLKYEVQQSGITLNPSNVGVATPTVVEQIRQMAQTAEDIAQSVRDDADAGEFDGFSPVVDITQVDETTTISITDATHTATADIITPTANVEKVDNVSTITITDAQGTTTSEVVTPIANVVTAGEVSTITITDESGTTSAEITTPTADVSRAGNVVTIDITDKNGATSEDITVPTASVSKVGTTATINITDETGTTTAQVKDGFSPLVALSREDNITTISVTDEEGTTTADIVTPLAEVTKVGSVATINISDEYGDTTAQISDGFSPIATVTQNDNVTTISVQDQSGTTTANVVAPLADVTTEGKVSTINITDVRGTTTADITTPTAEVTKTGTVATITITDVNGTTTEEVYDGDDYVLTGQDKQDIADLTEPMVETAIQPTLDNIQSVADTANTNANTAIETAETAENIARGKAEARAFDTFADMESWLQDVNNKNVLKVGDNLYIKATDVPDYWISAVLNEPDAVTGYYYNVNPLESEVPDISNMMTTDTTQTITGAKNFTGGIQKNGVDVVSQTDYAGSVAGVVKIGSGGTLGVKVDNGGNLYIAKATDNAINQKTSQYLPIVPSNLDYAIEQGLGNNSLTWTDTEKQNARNTIGAVSNTDYGSASVAGVVKTEEYYGLIISSSNGYITTNKASNSDIDDKTQLYRPIVPNNLDYAIDSRWSIITTITDNTLVLNNKQEARLGELATLILNMPTTIDTKYESIFAFSSGATATTLTYSATPIIWEGTDCYADGSFVPEANTSYEIYAKLVNYNGTDPVIVARVGGYNA